MMDKADLTSIKAVFLDVFNTLARFWPPREQVQAQACREFGIVLDAGGVDRGYALADAFMNHENARAPLRTRPRAQSDAFFARYEQLVLQGAGVDVDLAVAARIWQCVRHIPYGLTLFDDVLPALTRLRQRGLTLGAISNMNRQGGTLAQELGLDGTIHFVVTSFEVQAEKPHPSMFRAALARAGVAPHEAVHVGDQLASDVEGARAVGIHPVLMDRYGTQTPPVGCPLVRGMSELEELLTR